MTMRPETQPALHSAAPLSFSASLFLGVVRVLLPVLAHGVLTVRVRRYDDGDALHDDATVR